MKININGITREMTPEEEKAYLEERAKMPPPEPTPEERIKELEEALALILSGVTQ